MRVNIYAEEMTERVEVIEKRVGSRNFTAVRFYLYLPVTTSPGHNVRGPFKHAQDDDDSSAVTFWGKKDLRVVLRKALKLLDKHYADRKSAHKRLLAANKAFLKRGKPREDRKNGGMGHYP